jgi:DNA-binding CsgD family transcriptional regulator
MEQLTSHDIQNLNQGIQQIYALHDFAAFGVNSLQIVNRLVASEIPVFHITDTKTFQVQDTFLPNFPGLTPELVHIKSEYLYEHPITQNMPQALKGACKISDFLSRQEFHNLEGIYQNFMRPLETEDQMMMFLPSKNSGSWKTLGQEDTTLIGFVFNRSQRSFTERDRLILNLLRPHLFQAYCNTQQYHCLQTASDQFQSSLNHLGLIVLNEYGQVQLMTSQASAWLTTYFSGAHNGQLPEHLWFWAKHQINMRANAINLSTEFLPLRIQNAHQQLVIRLIVNPDNQQYLLMIEEQTKSLLNSLELLGLSQRETQVLAAVMQGKENRAIATHMNVGISTIRKHLESIYQKWGISSRTEAIAYALEKLGLL